MLDTVNTQYDSFLYWRMPIPELDLSELEGLGLNERTIYKPKGGFGKLPGDRKHLGPDVSEDDNNLLQFNSFNFWRAPINPPPPGLPVIPWVQLAASPLLLR
uniref:Protein AF1q n=1 Tax=Sphenodon punctatus TaxID=8508 RepID=A0A8D0L336_SPHPU